MRRKLRSLYICYLSLEDPLVHTQVVAYLEGLARRGHTLHLLTFDPELPAGRRRALRDELAGRGITWHSLRYHKRPSLPATVYDCLVGALVATRLIRRHRLDAVHARNHVPAVCSMIAQHLTRCRFIFDLRGLMAEEYVDAGRWRRGGLPYRITNRVQRVAIRRADHVVMLTEALRRYLFADAGPDAPLTVIPCCVDFARLNGSREPVGGNRSTMVYVGKFSGRYMEREVAQFFAAARALEPNLFFLVLTQSDRAAIERELAEAQVPQSAFEVTQSPPGEIGGYLERAGFGVSFYQPGLGGVACSPTKVGEYLGAGLPVIVSAGTGDLDELLDGEGVGVVVRDFSATGYQAAAREILALAADPNCAAHCRAVARERLSLERVGIPRYDRLYSELAQSQ